MVVTREGRELGEDSKGSQYMAMEDDLTLGGGHKMQYTGHVS